MKHFLKVVSLVIGGVCILLLMGIATYWLKYQSIVNTVHSNETENIKPGTLGKWVNTFIGTGGFPAWVCGYNFPGATVPFGMVRLSPETSSFFRNTRGLNTSGYYYGDSKILGFSHTRLAGTGATDGGHFLITPVTWKPEEIDYTRDFYYTFSHADETAFPGYYRVALDNNNVIAELTATERTGLHRYTFPDQTNKGILLNITNTIAKKRAENGIVNIDTERNEISGSVRTFGSFAGRYGGIKVYFVAQFGTPVTHYGIWDGKVFTPDLSIANSDTLIVYAGFDENIKKVNIKVGISHISIENARLNLETEADSLAFDEVLQSAIQKWEEKLDLIEIEGGSDKDKTIFYSALYRCFQMPTIFNDVNGEYFGFDKQVHQVTDFNYYTDLSLWDTFRTLHPLYILIANDYQRDMLVSLVKMAEQGGALPRWPSGNGYTGSMLGSPADMVVAESYLKGIMDFDVELAYEKIKAVALAPRPKGASYSGRRSIEGYLKYGFCPEDLGERSVSRTLEYAWADYAISQLAGALGNKADSVLFAEHSRFYKNLWNPKTQYFQSRYSDGRFVKKFKPLQLTYTDWDEEYTRGYVEGSALQWRWAVPFDTEGLMSLFKNRDYYISELEHFFEKANPKLATWIPDSYYWHGNEPDIHAAYLFNDAGRPDLTQKWVRWVLDNKYDVSYTGIDGNDDGATLSAWYIFSSLGIYPIAGTDIYQLGAPLFKHAKLRMGDNTLTIIAENYAPDNIYVKAVYLNDKHLSQFKIKHADIANGGTLRFVMSEKPE